MYKNKKILIIIPAYNEENNIGVVLDQLINHELKPDIVVINDNSNDKTAEVCVNKNVSLINLPTHGGISKAMMAGYNFAKDNNYDIAIQVDADGQHNPKYLAEMIEPLIENKADLVVGSRFIEKIGFQSSYIRRIGILIIRTFLKIIIGKAITDPTSGYRACNSKVIELFSQNYPAKYPEPPSFVILSKNSMNVIEIPVIMNERLSGKSSISGINSVDYMTKTLFRIIFYSF